MVKTPTKLTFKQYLEYDDSTDNRYELFYGELVKLPPESGLNIEIALTLMYELAKLIDFLLIRPGNCELQVTGNPQNRFPDLVILREEHRQLTKKRCTVTLEMPPPQMVLEIVSPYKNQNDDNYQRDYVDKVQQYQARGIPEYWIIDPQAKLITILTLKNGSYEQQKFRGDEQMISQTFPDLKLTVAQVISAS